MMKDILTHILTAPVYDVAKKTPLEFMPQLSVKLNHHIYAKREDLQPVFSFKCRGAYNKLVQLLDENPNLAGVIAASAGNHAQGLALAAQKLGVHATIVMPNIAPEIKIKAVKRFGGDFVTVVIHGDNFDEAAAYAKQLEIEQSLVFVHPFDDPAVIAGQGTVGKELVEQLRHIDAVFIPVGGGGLLAGVGAYIKSVKPDIKIIAVEHVESASMQAAIAQVQLVTLSHVGVFADGIAVKRAGEHTFAVAREVVDETVTVTTDQICAAINDIFDETRMVVEPSGAASLAGLKKWCQQNEGGDAEGLNLIHMVSGANMNFDRLRHVTERTALGAQTECLLGVSIPERPGAFKALCELINGRAITEFNYRYSGKNPASVFIGLGIRNGRAEIGEIIDVLRKADYDVSDFSDNDTAKLHMRYMIGGKRLDKSELLYRFEFPERPGALLNFLQHMGGYNITLFHYRNHGSDYGRVLIGIETPDDIHALTELLDAIGYYYVDETSNPAYGMFL